MPRRRPSAALPAAPLLLAALAALLLPSAHAGGGLGKRGTEFTPSVVMTKQDEYGQHCRTAVDRAFALGAVNVKFVPTVFYYPAKVQATGGDGVGSYAFRDASWQYQPASPGTIAQFQEDLTNCLQYAVSKGMGVGVLVHLDNASGYTWRNALEFDPLAKYGGYSYDDVVLKPVATALNKVLRPGVDVVLTVNGETGRSVAQYAASWLKLVQESKKRILANRPRVDPREVSVGISLNYNRLAGWVDFDSAVKPSLSYYFLDLHQKSLPPATRAKFQKVWNDGLKKYPIDADNLRKLYEAVDVIGVSAYPPLKVDFSPSDLESTLNYYAEELGFLGVDLRKLVNDQGKRLVISEWGIGGGVEEGDKIASSLEKVARNPFFGLWYPYKGENDPWANPEYANYRRKLYKATADWLKKRGGPNLRLDGVYMWNAGSWDAVGVNPTSGGNWIDPKIQSMVRAHNAQVNSV